MNFTTVLQQGFERMEKSPVDISTNGATTLKLCREAIQTFYLPKLIEKGGTPEEIKWLEDNLVEIKDAIDASTHPNGAVIDAAKNGFDLTEFGSLENLIKKQVGFMVKGRYVKMDFFISQEVIIDEEYNFPKAIHGRRHMSQHVWDTGMEEYHACLSSEFLSIMDKLGIKVGVFYKNMRFLGYKQRAYNGSFATAKILNDLMYQEAQEPGASREGVNVSASSLMDDIKSHRKDILRDLRSETSSTFKVIVAYKEEKDRLMKLKKEMERKARDFRTLKEEELPHLAGRKFSKKELVSRFLPNKFGTEADAKSFNQNTYLGISALLDRNRTDVIARLSTHEFKSNRVDLVNGLLMMCQSHTDKLDVSHVEECMPLAMIEFAKKSMHVWHGKEWAPEERVQTFQSFQAPESEMVEEEEQMFFEDTSDEQPMFNFAPSNNDDYAFFGQESDVDEFYQ